MPILPSSASSQIASFTVLDWALVATLTWSTVLAFVHGLLREVCSLVGLLAGIVIAGWYYPVAAHWLEQWIASAAAANLTGFLLIALGIGLIAGLLGRLFRRTASTVGLGFLDRLAGGVFGLVRGGLLATALLMAITAFLPAFPALRSSRLAPYFLRAAHGISFFVPPDLQAQISGGADALKHMPSRWIKPRR